ncbi:MAG: hypothetical protein JXR25_01585 [Pontiellaceae bacterium]|nr:hypothetical protein [Pontiellaceae bacterium]MBN2783491.1 hypothetical protein [Pontiellaceae bacterium]
MIKQRKPVFTYVVTILNGFIPPFILSFIGMLFVWRTNTESDDSYSFYKLYQPAYINGMLVGVTATLIYFFLLRSRFLRPRWWTTLLLVLLTWLIIPIFAMISAPLDQNACPAGKLVFDATFTAFIGFILIHFLAPRLGKKKGMQNPAPISISCMDSSVCPLSVSRLLPDADFSDGKEHHHRSYAVLH